MKYLTYLATILLLVACAEMNDLHQKYLDEGETIYTGRVDSIQVKHGKERLKLSWQINADPKIIGCKIFWNNRKDSVVTDVHPNRVGVTLMEQLINLSEGSYVFEFITFDDNNNSSLSVVKSSDVYGSKYEQALLSRPIVSLDASRDSAVIKWSKVDNSIGVLFKYTNRVGDEVERYVSKDDNQTVIYDYAVGSEYSYQTMYMPSETAIDTFYSAPYNKKFPSAVKLNNSDWEVVFASSEESTDGQALAILDGNKNTFWHSQWRGGAPDMPHTIIIDMKDKVEVMGVDIFRRLNNKDTKKVEYEISLDNKNWTSIGNVSFPNNKNPNNKELMLQELVKGRYLKIIVSESNSYPHASLSEIVVYGRF
ncbi:MAG: DUF4998 domain-containing protein [Bacteroidales bacterium]